MSETCFCTQCGQRLPANINFCPYCGNRLAGFRSSNANTTQEAAVNTAPQANEAQGNQFYVFALQGPAFGNMPAGDIVLEKARVLYDGYEPAKDMQLKLIRPSMWSARVKSSGSYGVVSVSFSISDYTDDIRSYLLREGIPGELIEKGLELSNESSLQLSNPMSGVFVMGIPILRVKAQPDNQEVIGESAAAFEAAATEEDTSASDNTISAEGISAAPVTEAPISCVHEYKHYVTRCGVKAPKPVLSALGTRTYNQYTYEYYRANSPEEAKHFLELTEVNRPLYYVMVETPEGKWGRDKDGIFLEHLCDFQNNLSLAQCQAETAILPVRMQDVQMAANKVTDNYLLTVRCGGCGCEWLDGVKYRSKTIVRCPECGKYNLADTKNIRFNDL